MREFWYQAFHQLPLIEQILDGDPVAVRAYLAHFWNHWSGPDYTPSDARLDHLAAAYGEPGAMTASIGWYRAGSGGVAQRAGGDGAGAADRHAHHGAVAGARPALPARVVDRLDVFFSDVDLRWLDGAGHFTPLEAPEVFAAAIRERR